MGDGELHLRFNEIYYMRFSVFALSWQRGRHAPVSDATHNIHFCFDPDWETV